MTTIQLHIPDDLAQKVLHLGGNAETFIIEMLRSKVNDLDKPSLAEEYRMAGIENTALTKEFTHIDSEGWDDEY